jgi:hypothetical protein
LLDHIEEITHQLEFVNL